MRYQIIFGPGANEGAGLQGSLPSHVFKALSDLFDVGMECFASPLNCHFRLYCSAFSDTDSCFGSCGSFFKFSPVSGSFQVNPPFEQQVMLRMVEHLERLLDQSAQPLSFIVFVPDWNNPPCEAIERMKVSR